MNEKYVTISQLKSELESRMSFEKKTPAVIKFNRKVPKCLSCGKKSMKWLVDTNISTCECGGKIERVHNTGGAITSFKGNHLWFVENGAVKQCVLQNLVEVQALKDGEAVKYLVVQI